MRQKHQHRDSPNLLTAHLVHVVAPHTSAARVGDHSHDGIVVNYNGIRTSVRTGLVRLVLGETERT